MLSKSFLRVALQPFAGLERHPERYPATRRVDLRFTDDYFTLDIKDNAVNAKVNGPKQACLCVKAYEAADISNEQAGGEIS